MNPDNPANGKYGTYRQNADNQLLNNGQTTLTLQSGVGLNVSTYFGGSEHMYSQNGIHNTLGHPLFYSTANGL